jgi:hypothetical protein
MIYKIWLPNQAHFLEKIISGNQFAANNCAIKFEQKKIDINAYINGTPLSQLQWRKFCVVRIGYKNEQLQKIKDQIGRDWQIITTPHN